MSLSVRSKTYGLVSPIGEGVIQSVIYARRSVISTHGSRISETVVFKGMFRVVIMGEPESNVRANLLISMRYIVYVCLFYVRAFHFGL